MFDRFNRHSKCKFIVRIEGNLLPENYNKSQIKVTDKFINQQEILCNIYLLIIMRKIVSAISFY